MAELIEPTPDAGPGSPNHPATGAFTQRPTEPTPPRERASFTPSHLVAIHAIHETFARVFASSLSDWLQTDVHVSVLRCAPTQRALFESQRPPPASRHLIRADGLPDAMALDLGPRLVYPILNRLLGGVGHEHLAPGRRMTPLEHRLIQGLVQRALPALTRAWSPLRELVFRLEQDAPPAPGATTVAAIDLGVHLWDAQATLAICAPQPMIAPILERRPHPPVGPAPGTRSGANALLSADLAHTSITLRDLADMASGDLIVTETPASSPVVVRVDGEPRFLAQIAPSPGPRTVKVTEPAPPDCHS